MNQFKDVENPAIIPALNKNMLEIFKLLSRSPKSDIKSSDEIIWSITRIPHPLFNFVLHSSLKTGGAESAIENVIAECRSRNVPLMWRIEPDSQPEHLGTLLEKHGFQRLDSIPGMVIDIQKNICPPYPNGFEIKRVNSEKILSGYLEVIKETVGMPDFAIQGLFELSVFLGFEENLPLQRFLGYFNGQPVATCMSVLGVGVVGIYDVVTKKKARKNGIGSVMTFHSLEIAKRQGYNVGVLTSSEMAQSMYEKLGFSEVCKIHQYLWSPQPSA